jgi:nitroreductase
MNIPDHFAVLNMLSIGYPNEERKPYDMEKLPVEKIHNNVF